MLSKQNRLTTKEFNTAFSKGRRFHGDLSTVLYISSLTLKVAVVVSIKVTKSKPVRNKLRRQVYEILRTSPLKTGTYIFLLKKEALVTNYATLSQSITKLLTKQLSN